MKELVSFLSMGGIRYNDAQNIQKADCLCLFIHSIKAHCVAYIHQVSGIQK